MTSPVFKCGMLFLLMAAVGLATGCGGGQGGVTVSGTASFNDKPIEKGYVSFYPADGKGNPAGGEVVGGKFSVSGVTEGKNRVEVSSSAGSGPATTSMEDTAKDTKKAPPKDALLPDDDGNNQVHDISSGATLDLKLRTKVTSGGGRK